MTKRYQLDVTEKQLQTIATACEVYGRIQYGQSYMISEHIPFKNYSDRFDFEEKFRLLLSEYEMNFPHRAENCDIAFDMWRKISRKDDFTMGTEPVIDVVEYEFSDNFDISKFSVKTIKKEKPYYTLIQNMNTDTYVHSYRKVMQHIVYNKEIIETLVYESEHALFSNETPSSNLKITNKNSLFFTSLEYFGRLYSNEKQLLCRELERLLKCKITIDDLMKIYKVIIKNKPRDLSTNPFDYTFDAFVYKQVETTGYGIGNKIDKFVGIENIELHTKIDYEKLFEMKSDERCCNKYLNDVPEEWDMDKVTIIVKKCYPRIEKKDDKV